MLLFARMARLSHLLGRRSHNSAVAQYQKVIDKHFSKTGDLAWTGQQAARIVAHDCRRKRRDEEVLAQCLARHQLIKGQWIGFQSTN
jgi:hypothetical protein